MASQEPEHRVDYFYFTDESGDKYQVLPNLTTRLVKKAKRKPKGDRDPVSFKL